MIDVIVIRGAGDKQGDDVVDGLIGSLPVALARGRAELDERGQAMKNQNLEAVYRDGLRLGHLLRVNDMIQGSLAMKVAGISHNVAGGRITTNLTLRRSA